MNNATTFVAGGQSSTGYEPTAEVIQSSGAVSQAFLPAPPLLVSDHAAALLPTGQLAVIGGYSESDSALSSVKVGGPVTPFGDTGITLSTSRFLATANVLRDGRVVVLGGVDRDTLDVLDPRASAFERSYAFTPSQVDREVQTSLIGTISGHSATLLPNGLVLVAGGVGISQAFLFDPDAFSWTQTGGLSRPRARHSATLLNDGRVALVGGTDGAAELGSIEIYDPATGAFSLSATTLGTPRHGHTATIADGGAVLVLGGLSNGSTLSSREVLSLTPPDLSGPMVTTAAPTGSRVFLGHMASVAFSEPIDPRSVMAATMSISLDGAQVAGTRSVAESGLLAFFIPNGGWTAGATYQGRIEGVLDRSGNPVTPFSWSFETYPGPVIDAISPSEGSSGTTVTLTGSGFGRTVDTNRVVWNGISLEVLSAAENSVRVRMPSSSEARTAPLILEAPGGTATSPTAFTLSLPVPRLLAVAPLRIAAGSGDTVVTLTGDSFLDTAQVSFEGTWLSPVISGHEATVIVPAALLTASRRVEVRLSNSASGPLSNPLFIDVTEAPRIASISLSPKHLSLSVGGSASVTARAYWSDGTSQDVSPSVITSSSAPGIMNVAGLSVTGTSPGTGSIIAIYGSMSATATVVVVANDPLPPDPITVAPPLDRTASTTMFDSVRFLFEGGVPIQTGVAPGTIEPRRIVVLRGRVLMPDGTPLSGVTVDLPRSPGVGRTLTRADGQFDLAVNGGPLMVRYSKPGFLSVQRNASILWQEFYGLPDVALTPLDVVSTYVDLAAATTTRPARSSTSTDGSGSRASTLLFNPGTSASLTLADGSTQALAALTVRATEFTVGPNGPRAMPGDLPASSGYTFATELSADEAMAVGATRVDFSQPVYHYVENFLGFPVGTPVPSGYYDRQQGAWVPSEDGRIVRVLGVTAGLATIDLTGSGGAASAVELAAAGFSDSERAALVSLFTAGQSLWRVPIRHFTPYDFNWPMKPPPDATQPQGDPSGDSEEDEPTCKGGSLIECQNQTLGEGVDVVGTGMSLHYRSNRTPGRKAAYRINIPITLDTPPASLRRVQVEIHVAGRKTDLTFSGSPNQTTDYEWNGLDAFGRRVQGVVNALIRIGYVYGGVYTAPLARATLGGASSASFGGFGGATLTGSETREEITIWRTKTVKVGAWDVSAEGLGGWTLSEHHRYDVPTGVLHYGDGSQRKADVIPNVARKIAQAQFAEDLAVGPDGSTYVASFPSLRIAPDGSVSTLTGVNARFLDVAPDGTMYFTAGGSTPRIMKRSPTGVISVFAGNGTVGTAGDGGPAVLAQLGNNINDVVVGPDGAVYISDNVNSSSGRFERIRRVDADGIIVTVVGAGPRGFSGDGGPAKDARIAWADAIAFSPSGELHFNDNVNKRVRKVSLDGIISTVAGNGTNGNSATEPEGVPATSTGLYFPEGLAFDRDGNMYVGTWAADRIRKVSPDGTMRTVAGDYPEQPKTDGSAAVGTPAQTGGVSVSAAGEVMFTDMVTGKAFAIRPAIATLGVTEFAVPFEDASEVYTFDARGRHLSTRNALTGAVSRSLFYDGDGKILLIRDGDGNEVSIERSASGAPVAVIGPYGHRTSLTLTNGYLTQVEDPIGRTTGASYDPDGLLTSLIDRRGQTHPMVYDALGRLESDTDPVGGGWALSRTDGATSHTVTMTDGAGRASTFSVEKTGDGGRLRTNTDANGLATTLKIGQDAIDRTTTPDGMVESMAKAADPRFGLKSPVSSTTVKTPAGKALSVTSARSVTLSTPTDPLTLQSLIETTNVNGRTYTSTYNALTRSFSTNTPQGRLAPNAVMTDSQGRVTEMQTPGNEPVQFFYDERGRLVRSVQAERISRLTYDGLGRPALFIDPIGRETQLEYDGADRLLKQVLPDGREVAFQYDAHDNMTSLTPPGRPAHTFSFTGVDLPESYTPPALPGVSPTTTQFNLAMQPTSITRGDGEVVGFGYDTGGRISTMAFGRGITTFSYHPTTGNLQTLVDPSGEALAFSYDGALPLSTTWSGAIVGSVSRTFDNDFRVTTEQVNNAFSVNFGYDLDSLLTSAGSLTISRDTRNGRITGTLLAGVRDTWIYDRFGEVQSYSAVLNGTQPVFGLDYLRDNLGRITSLFDTVAGVTTIHEYSYDVAGRLSTVRRNGAEVASYTYDPNGNRLTAAGERPSSGIYDAQDRLLSDGTSTYTYRGSGELLTKTTGSAVTTYSYDALGNLISASLPSGRLIEYVVDGASRRVGRKVNGALVQGFLYSSTLRIAAELDGAGAVVSRFVYGTRINVPEFMQRGGITYRILTDHLGSVRLVINTTDNTITQRMDYDAWGNVVADTNPDFQPFGYAGGLYDRDTGLTRFGARDYDPAAGRFTTPDPLGFGGGPNRYQYAEATPTNAVDPTGLFSGPLAGAPVVTAAVGAIGAATAGIAALVVAEVALIAYDVHQAAQLACAYGYCALADALNMSKGGKQNVR